MDKTGGKVVMVIGATNRPDSLDGALRRAGRFDREICLGVPNEIGRAQILKGRVLYGDLLSNAVVLSSSMKLEGNFDFVEIAKKTPGFVGADLTALTKEAANVAISRIFSELEKSSRQSAASIASTTAMDIDGNSIGSANTTTTTASTSTSSTSATSSTSSTASTSTSSTSSLAAALPGKKAAEFVMELRSSANHSLTNAPPFTQDQVD